MEKSILFFEAVAGVDVTNIQQHHHKQTMLSLVLFPENEYEKKQHKHFKENINENIYYNSV